MKCQCVTLATAVWIIKITVFWVNLSWNLPDKATSLHSHQAVTLIVVKFDFQTPTFVCQQHGKENGSF